MITPDEIERRISALNLPAGTRAEILSIIASATPSKTDRNSGGSQMPITEVVGALVDIGATPEMIFSAVEALEISLTIMRLDGDTP